MLLHIILGFYSDKLFLVLLTPSDNSKWLNVIIGKGSTIKHEVSQGHDKNDKTISVCQGSEAKCPEILRNGDIISHDN